MNHYFESITNIRGDALIGYYTKAIDTSSGSALTIYADGSGTPISSVSGVTNAAKVDTDGNVSFWLDDSVTGFHLDIYATDATTFVKRVQNIGVIRGLTGAQGPAGDVAKATNRTALAAIAGATTGLTRYLAEAGREGLFVFDTSNLSSAVSADTQQGIYVAPSSDPTGASGAWVRKYSGPVDIRWFGAVADCTAYGVGTDNSAAIQVAITTGSATGRAIYIPEGKYRCSTRIDIKSAVRIVGTTILQSSLGATAFAAAAGSTLVFDSGVAGLKLFYIADGDLVAAATNPGATGTIIDGVRLLSASQGSASSAKYGIEARGRVILRNVEVRGFGDHGIVLWGSVTNSEGVVYGNVNLSKLENVKSLINAGAGFYMTGGDCNVVNLMGCHAQGNTGWGFDDNSLIGNQYWGCLVEGNTAGGFINRRVGAAASYVGCEDEGATSSLTSSCYVRGNTLGQKSQGQTHEMHGRVHAYEGLTVRNGNQLTLNNTGDTIPLSISNDGTNWWLQAPLKVSGSIQCRSGSIGYIIGNGGAVTQLTSRTTGVTINAPSGQITLFSAAGSATWQTFTVTNSSVAATDTIDVNQASGTDIYQIMVSNVSAGSFKISFATTGGTTTEQPKFNFTVTKGSNA